MTQQAMPPGAPLHAGEPLRFPTLDGVRFFAYLAVFLSHAVPLALYPLQQDGRLDFIPYNLAYIAYAGGFGVDLFLVLSAFLITSLLLKEHDALGTIHVGDFYVRRMLRIWPLYLVFLGTMFVVSNLGLDWPGFQPHRWEYWVAFLGLVGNWVVGLSGYPGGNIDPLWSVSLEEQFYLFWPWLLLLLRRRLVAACLVLWAVSVAARIAVAMIGLPHPATWTLTITRLDPIALGCLLAIANRRKRLPTFHPAVQWLLFAGGFASWPILHALVPMEGGDLGAALFTLPAAALAAAGILTASVGSTGLLNRLLMSRFAVRMGGLSYGSYVFHYLTLNVTLVLLEDGSLWVNLALLPIVGFVLAWLLAEASYRWLESPFLRLRKRFRPVGPSPVGPLPGFVPSPTPSSSPAAPSVEDRTPAGKDRP